MALANLRNIDDLLTLLGGTNEVAKLVGRSPSAVSQWVRPGRRIPADLYFELDDACKRLGYRASPRMFSFQRQQRGEGDGATA